jgi:hypothetical protein
MSGAFRFDKTLENFFPNSPRRPTESGIIVNNDIG